ncbi:hypothetical protein [Bacillus sp. NPDC094106]|uniref:hypothetical protein n=1 Tax=Bacillus sp. NPDC094106 TaxID=3363949 RepID=UPI0037FD4C48
MKNFEISVEKTAIRNGISKSTSLLYSDSNYMNHNVLDYGAGRLRNAKFLRDEGFIVDILDTPKQVFHWSPEEMSSFHGVWQSIYLYDLKISHRFSRILCSFVLNVIPKEHERIEVLSNINLLLENEGIAYIEVRREKSIMKAKTIESFSDGFVLGKGNVRTFQKPFSKESFEALLKKSNLKIKKLINYPDSIVAICEKG